MSETAVINASSTIGAFVAQEQVQAQPEQSTETQSVESNTATVNESGQLNISEQPTAPVAETSAQPAQEANEASFSIGFSDDEPVAQTEQATAPQQSFNWKDEIKKLDKKELLKELGFSDFALEIDEHIQRGGQPVDYLNAKGVNWDNVSDMDILKAQFTSKYAFLTAEQQTLLFNDKYGITELDDDDVKARKEINRKIDANQIRADKKTEQSKFKLPEAKTPTEQNKEWAEMQNYMQQEQQKAEATKQYIVNHPSVQSLIQSKRVAIPLGEGEKPFNFNIDKPELVVKAILDGSFYKKVIYNEKGELNVDKLLRITKYAFNPDQHDRDMFNYGKSRGVKTLVEEGQNAKKPNGQPSPQPAVSEREAWKNPKQGKLGNILRG